MTRPNAIPRSGWIWRVKSQIGKDNLSVVAAGVSFYTFLSIFPALAALVSIYALVTDPAKLQEHITSAQVLLPAEAAQLVNQQLQRIVQSRPAELGWSLLLGTLVALWSAAKGMSSLIAALNVAYDEIETRSFLKLNALALSLTLAGILFLIIFLFLIVGIPAVLNALDLGGPATALIIWVRWPLLAIGGIVALGVLYRYAPNRDTPNWRWITGGAVIATVLWLVGSVLFSYYVANFSSYNAVYGSLGVVVILMMWLLLSVYCILLGAKINAAIEHQAKADTTVVEPKPRGERGAHVADRAERKTG
ncbi:MAG: YihY/virulence factor BrkB family protein [Candidatus Binatia bacterium]